MKLVVLYLLYCSNHSIFKAFIVIDAEDYNHKVLVGLCIHYVSWKSKFKDNSHCIL